MQINSNGFIPIIILVAVMVVGGSGTAAVQVSKSSLPGEPLYNVKELTERVRLELARTPETKAQVYLDIANTKLQEVEKLEAKGAHIDKITALLEKYKDYQSKGLEVLGKSDSVEAKETIKEQIKAVEEKRDKIVQKVLEKAPEEAKSKIEKVAEQSKNEAQTFVNTPTPSVTPTPSNQSQSSLTPTASKSPSPSPSTAVLPSPSPTPTGQISANPNPCTLSSSYPFCSTTISWSSSNATDAKVYADGELFTGSTGKTGSVGYGYIKNTPTKFDLKDGSGTVLASVSVTGQLPADKESPFVDITSPRYYQDFYPGDSVTIQASAKDNVAVSKVEFYIRNNTGNIATLICSPAVNQSGGYSCNWPDRRYGLWEVTVTAYDALNNKGQDSTWFWYH